MRVSRPTGTACAKSSAGVRVSCVSMLCVSVLGCAHVLYVEAMAGLKDQKDLLPLWVSVVKDTEFSGSCVLSICLHLCLTHTHTHTHIHTHTHTHTRTEDTSNLPEPWSVVTSTTGSSKLIWPEPFTKKGTWKITFQREYSAHVSVSLTRW